VLSAAQRALAEALREESTQHDASAGLWTPASIYGSDAHLEDLRWRSESMSNVKFLGSSCSCVEMAADGRDARGENEA
jgi:hypothetical protein